MLTPAGVLLIWLRGILSVALLVAAGWLVFEWSERAQQGEPVRQAETATGEASPPRDPSAPDSEVTAPRRSLRDWRPGWDEPTALLAGAVALLLLSSAGRFVGPWLLRKSGPDVPSMEGGDALHLVRPDGTRLHVRTFGPAGPTIVASHGWGTDCEEWAYLRRLVEHGWRVIVWDMPGMGRSGRPGNDDYSMEKFANDLRAVVQVAGDQPVVLCGHSIGGMTTLTFCRLFPELLGKRIRGLILAHTTYRNPVRTMWGATFLSAIERPVIVPLLYLQIALSPIVWLMNCLSYFNGSIHWSNTFTGFGGTETRQKLDFISRYSLTTAPAVLARGCLGMLRYDVENVLPHIPIPVLCLIGDRDPVTPPTANRHISDNAPAGRYRDLAPAKHYGFFEHDEAFLQTVSEFCSSVVSELWSPVESQRRGA